MVFTDQFTTCNGRTWHNCFIELFRKFIKHLKQIIMRTNFLFKLVLVSLFLSANAIWPGIAIAGKDAGILQSEKAEELVKLYDKADTPGGAILVMRDGEVIYKHAFGMANISHGVPFSAETPTNIGSTSKQFTAFAIGLLEEQGLLSLDDDIRDYIPGLPDFGEPVRLWHLISHTSGYREYLNTLVMSGRYLGDHMSLDEVVPMLQRQPELQNTPGGMYNYNNTGYALLAMVVEKATGEAFPEWMKENVFLPLGMYNTQVLEKSGQIIKGSAQGYSKDGNGNFYQTNDLNASMGPGGIYSTVEDLAIWVKNFHKPVVGSRALIQKMQTPFILNKGDTLHYGMGLIIDKLNGLKRVEHGGADIAHRSSFFMFPDVKGAVIVQSNSSAFPGNIAVRVAEVFFADIMDLEPKADDVVDPEDFVFDIEKFDELVGRYELEDAPGFILEFYREDDKMFTRATGQGSVEVFASSDSTFYITIVEASMTFHRNDQGEVDAMTLHQNGHHRANRIYEPKWIPSQDDIDNYVGRYFSEELEAFYIVSVNDEGELVLRHRRFDDIPLKAEAKDDYVGAFPISGIKFIRDENNNVTGFRASSQRSFGIVFEKMQETKSL